MAHKSRAIIACLALVVFGACSTPTNNSAAPASPAASAQSNSYQGVGVVKSIDAKAPAIEIDHDDIEGLMPAMQMEFPVTDAALLNGIAVNDRIDFTVEASGSEMKVTAIKKK